VSDVSDRPGRELLLGIDVGTTSVKVSAYASDGTLVADASEQTRVERPRDGWIEQDPDEIWRAVCQAVRALPARERIVSIGACGHSPTLILLDRGGRPVRSAILWQDRRAAAESVELAERLGTSAAQLFGGPLPVTPSYPHPRLLWLRRNEPDALDRAAHALDTKDWVNYRLTGLVASDPWSAKALANMRTGEPIQAWRELLGVDPGIAPPTRPASSACGPLCAEAAAELGLAPGTTVAIGWTDGACSMLGTGCFAASGVAYAVAGTSEVIGTTVPNPPSDPRIQSAPGPDPRWTLLMGPTQSSGASVTWLAGILGVQAPELFALAAEAPSGANGLVFLPYLEGERAPIWDPSARGMLFGLSSSHGRAEMARAVLEGVTHSARHVLETIEEITGCNFGELRVCGGGSRSALWNQVKADLLGRTVRTTTAAETTSIGAAMLGGVAAGVFGSLDEAAGKLVRLGETYEPKAELRSLYDQAHHRYRELYPRVRDLY
jgi:xylulokinase